MSQEPHPSLDTKEFVAGWKNIVEEHFLRDLSDALRRLTAADPGGSEALARHVTHALQVAAGSAGGVEAAVHYLCEAANQADQSGSR
jgi:hypothetical protein